jgi:hypothetical protein
MPRPEPVTSATLPSSIVSPFVITALQLCYTVTGNVNDMPSTIGAEKWLTSTCLTQAPAHIGQWACVVVAMTAEILIR